MYFLRGSGDSSEAQVEKIRRVGGPAISTKSDKSAPLISSDDLMEALYMNPLNSLGDLILFSEIISDRENHIERQI